MDEMMMNPLSKYSSAALVVLIALLLIPLVPLSSSSTSFSMELIDPANPKHPSYHPSQLHNTLPPINTPVQIVGWQYYVSFSVGSPATELLGAMDLASDLTWAQCCCMSTYKTVPCSSGRCLHLSSGSTKCSGGTCKYSVSYANGSYSKGTLATDTFKLGKTIIPYPMLFGCGKENNGLMGVVGLGEGNASIVGQLQRRSFSYWLLPNASILTIGGPTAWGSRTLTLGMVKGPKKGPAGYYLNLLGVSVEVDNSLRTSPPYKGVPMLVNPQTILTTLPSRIYDFLQREVNIKVRKQLKRARDPTGVFKLCYNAKTNNDTNLPETITLIFQDGNVTLPKVNMFAKLDYVDVVCLAALPAQKDDVPVYGGFAQTNFGVGFNLESRAISFKRIKKKN